MKSAEILTEIQEILAPLAYRRFDAAKIYSEVAERVEALRERQVNDLLLGTIDFQTRVAVGIEEGEPTAAISCVLNEIADWKQANGAY